MSDQMPPPSDGEAPPEWVVSCASCNSVSVGAVHDLASARRMAAAHHCGPVMWIRDPDDVWRRYAPWTIS